MADVGGEPNGSNEYRAAVAYLCLHFGALREILDRGTWTRLIVPVRSADPGTDDWREAVRALHDAVEGAGVPGGLGLQFLMGWPGQAAAEPVRGWVCPDGRCDRVEAVYSPSLARPPAPRCELRGCELRSV